jgi:cell wall-associated NlpC family hydrolase
MPCAARLLLMLAIVLLAGLVLACGSNVVVSRGPRWACPSPTPKPWGPDGPVKEIIRHPRPTTPPSSPIEYDEEPIYYAEWEQEYPNQGPPFPSPTPYAMVGTSYVFGQRVEIWPLHVGLTARPGPLLSRTDGSDAQQLYVVDIAWVNHTAQPIPLRYDASVALRSITAPGGAVQTGAGWSMSARAVEAAGLPPPPASIPPGASQVSIPIVAPPGTPKTVELRVVGDPAYTPDAPSTTATPTPNAQLQRATPNVLTIQWTDAALQIPGAPPCADPGALTDWSNGDGVAWGVEVPAAPIPAPPGAGRLVQIALNQIGKPYIWGAKGPNAFDCSGLATWSYAQIGITIPQGTAGQWPRMRAVERSQIQPGDLVFFDMELNGRISHVGILAGDLNGDGTWDMVHAASPQHGIRIDYSIFESRFYGLRVRGFRTAR